MKKHTRSFLLLFIIPAVLFTTWSCNPDDPASPEGQGQMSAIVSGERWEAETVSAGLVQGVFAISGTAANGSTISLRLDGAGVGEYNSFSGSSNASVWQPSAGALGYTSNAPMGFGQVMVEEVNEQDTLISGTFFFLAQEPSSGDTISVFDGIFTDVKYHAGAAPVGDNFLKVKIDGALWEAVMVAGTVNGEQLFITATNADVTRTVGLFIPTDIAPGTYEIGSPFSADIAGQYNADAQTSLTAESGTLKITSHDKVNEVIEGTFSFEAAEFLGSGTASLTEGSFGVGY